MIKLELDQPEAKALAGIQKAALGDSSRPILTGIHFQARDGQLIFTTSDSYRLAQQFFPISGDDEAEGLFSAAQVATTLRKAKARANKVHLEWDEAHLEIRVFTGGGNFSCEFDAIPGSFPTVDTILKEIPWDEAWSELEGPQMVAFNPKYLAEMPVAIGAPDHIPVQMLCRGALKPAAFKLTESGVIKGRGVLMPVRL